MSKHYKKNNKGKRPCDKETEQMLQELQQEVKNDHSK